jgi:ATP-dependent RNA helicase RhlE
LTKFSDFGLAEPIQKALAAEGYETPTPIQTQAIPHLLAGRDLCGIAQTGTGKTAAFALPSLHHLAGNPRATPRHGCRMLVLSPTRELASQIAESFSAYGRFLKLSVTTVFGGVPINRQIRQLERGVDVLVATPGRLLDLIDQRALQLRDVEIFVLDEADQMLDLGFIHALNRIVPLLSRKRQSLFFSATMPKTIAELADKFLTDPVKVAVTPVATTAERVEQRVTFVNQTEKQALLTLSLRDPAFERTLVFTRTKHGADRVVRHLAGAGIAADAIHGNKSQPQRERALAAFRAGKSRVLVATDIAARGIDVEGVTHVVNFELPNVPEQYVHRIGRTARAGAAGLALSFCADDERPYLRDIEKLTRQKVEVAPLPANFLAEAAKLRKSVPPLPVRQERDERQGRGERPGHHDGHRQQPGGQPNRRRRFGRKKPAGVSVRAIGGRP